MHTISIVVPAYNEEAVLPEFHRRLTEVIEAIPAAFEVIYVNDGSSDRTLETIRQLSERDPRVAFVDLSRNFGKEIAMTAGFDHASGDAVLVIDADLQDPPELIPQLIREWQDGYDVVYAKRTARDGEKRLKKITAHAFYRVIQALSRVRIPEDTGDYRLLSRRAVNALGQLREQHRFMKGLFAWIGYPQKAVLYRREPRLGGTSKFDYWKLWNFALEGITSFTIAPLKIATYAGLLVALWAFLYGIWIIYKTLMFGDPVQGYPTLMVTILFLSGVQLTFIGVLGEYVGRMFDETKKRPLYFTNAYKPAMSQSQLKQPAETRAAALSLQEDAAARASISRLAARS